MPEADGHDLIRVHGARVNNLKDVSVEMPKRRLTVFTGVSGSGKSSLVFGTIAAESQRLINETYSAFVQGFMPTLARPEVDVLEGLTTAIIVDQQRMRRRRALDRRHGDRRERAAAHPLQPARRAARSARRTRSRSTSPRCGPRARSTVERGRHEDGAQELQPHRRHVPALRGHGHGLRHRPDASSTTTTKSLSTRARSRFPATASTAGTAASTAARASSTPTSRSGSYTKAELDDLLHKEPTRIKVRGINLTYEGLIPQMQKSILAKDGTRCSRTSARSSTARSTFTACPECDGTRLSEAARSSKIAALNIADACAMQISDLAGWVRRSRRAVGGAAARGAARRRSTRSSRSGSATSRSTARRARSRAARRSA